MRRSSTAISFSKTLNTYLLESDDEDAEAGDATTTPLLLPRSLLIDCHTRPARQQQSLRLERPPSHIKPRWVFRPQTYESTILRFSFHRTYMVWLVQPVSLT